MLLTKHQIPPNDPLLKPEQKKIIDEVLEKNKTKSGATMVVLNDTDKNWHYLTAMQRYIANKL